MGLFDFIGDALGAMAAPFTAVIDAGTKLLGLPPVVGDALKIAVGAATGDFVTLMQGSTQLLKDLAGSAAETEYAPDEAYGGTDGWAPTASLRAGATDDDLTAVDPTVGEAAPAAVTASLVGAEDPEERQALDALARNFDAMNRDHGPLGVSGAGHHEKELRVTAEDPDSPIISSARPGTSSTTRTSWTGSRAPGMAVTPASRVRTSTSLASRRAEHPRRSRAHRRTTSSMAFPRRRASANRRSGERSTPCGGTSTR